MSDAVAHEDEAGFNAQVVAEFHTHRGRVGGVLARTRLLLLHHVGAISGVERIVPLAYLELPDGSLLITASNGGAPTHPAWYHNLKANPSTTVEVGAESFGVDAHELDAADRARHWPTIVERAPTLVGRLSGCRARKGLACVRRARQERTLRCTPAASWCDGALPSSFGLGWPTPVFTRSRRLLVR